ncbi:MAG: phosphonate metabolism protein/1,5-bisphosphokinase (PRPP-forming) PhnN, partial [Burkholderiaceae bacterium]|nr:phosphonate metabolism protein/1,5-bisphosphokinase (PRPP-forming) PhnN [Burkholderiaceae bacterium]
YGFHATLKAPFHLAQGFSEANLEAMTAAFCQAQRRIAVPALKVKPLDDFLALRPEGAEEEIGALAMRCVSYFDLLRAAPSDSELATRRRRGLSQRQEALLQRWGYPYTEEEYRFHLTLSDDLREIDDDAAYTLRRAAEEHFAPVAAQAPFVIDRLSIFRESSPGAPFAAWRSFPFGDRVAQASLPAPGRLFFFVGPSGAGKDSLLRWVQQRLPHGNMVFARRTVTKPAASGDSHEAVDAATFWNLAAAGQFAMQWQVDGVSYGVRRGIEAELCAGHDVVVNGSREFVPQLQQLYPQAQVIWIEAEAHLLEERLAARGRESGAALLRRISRASQFPPLESKQVIRIDNSGEIETAGQRVLDILKR